MRPRKCASCSVEFLSRSSKKKYCDRCAIVREREFDLIRFHQKTRCLGSRKIGDIVACKNCGDDFTLTVGTMKYCAECRENRISRWKKDKRKIDVKFCLVERIRRGINSCLGSGEKAFRTWESLVGYTVEDLKLHLEQQFSLGMSWENRDRWHIDHILPVTSFDFSSAEDDEFRACWALTNLRPLWADENKCKSDKILYII